MNYEPLPEMAEFIRFRRGNKMIHHYITKYKEKGRYYAEAWLQIDILGKSFCLSKKRIRLDA